MTFSLLTLTVVHVAISLAAIGAGFVFLFELLTNKRQGAWTEVFLATTVATSATGFLFPIYRLTPGLIVGMISLGLLTAAIAARYAFQLAGNWRLVYVVSSIMAFYLNFFVLIVQLFSKVPTLKALAPTQTEPAFAVTHLVVLALFTAAGVVASLRHRGESSEAVRSGTLSLVPRQIL